MNPRKMSTIQLITGCILLTKVAIGSRVSARDVGSSNYGAAVINSSDVNHVQAIFTVPQPYPGVNEDDGQ